MLDLTGIEFKGSYQRRSDRVSQMREHRENLKKENPELLAEFDRIWGCSDTEDAVINRPENFTLRVLEYEASQGSFVAVAEDVWGKAGIVGEIGDKIDGTNVCDIKFTKIYSGKLTPRRADIAAYARQEGEIFRVTEYSGRLLAAPYTDMFCEGLYHVQGVSENYDGSWNMKAISEKAAPVGGLTVES